MKLNFEVRRKGSEELVATRTLSLLPLIRKRLKTVAIPQELRERLAPYNANEND
jgi:acyl-CoA thioesterase FadM